MLHHQKTLADFAGCLTFTIIKLLDFNTQGLNPDMWSVGWEYRYILTVTLRKTTCDL